MPGTFSALELRPDGDVALVRIKHAATKPTFKDIQVFLKKKTATSIITSYQ